MFYPLLLFRAALRAGVALFLPVTAIAQLSALRADPAHGAGQQAPGVDAVARPCKTNPTGSKPSKGANKNGKKKLNDAGAPFANACLEVHSTALEIQEYLQVYGREQKWSISDEHVGEDSWTLYRNLDKGEILRYTRNEARTGLVAWTSGKVFMQMRIVDLDDEFTRVQIFARFQGFGESSDRFAPPKGSWQLESNGHLENEIISALESHLKAAH